MGDVVQPQHFQRAGARHAHQHPDLMQEERQDRHGQVQQARLPVFTDRHVAHHRQPLQLQAEEDQQQQAQPESRDGHQQGCRTAQEQVGPFVLLPGREHAGGHGHQRGKQHRHQHHAPADQETVPHQRQHGLAGVDGRSQIAVQHVAEPDAELGQPGLVQPQARTQVRQGGRRRQVAQQQLGRIARNQPDHHEHRHRHDQQGRHGHDNSG
ncbi:hypothetical protein G6F65_018318 [Rhizopus arrhizus]|nr:hypothetical protein G6F65_018318 [Rhizopus arrhizus]